MCVGEFYGLKRKIMEVAELQEKIREVYKLINYQNVEFEWNEQLRKARKILNEIQSKLHQPTVSGSVCDNCRDVQGMYLGMTCPKCNRPFRDVKQTDL